MDARAHLRTVAWYLQRPLWEILDALVPKQRQLWLFASHQGHTGNPAAVLQAALRHPKLDSVTFIVVSESGSSVPKDRRVTVLAPRTVAARRAALRAGVVFVTHDVRRDVGIPLRPWRGRRFILNLWHGTAMKCHWMLRRRLTSQIDEASRFSALIASSTVDALAKAAAFRKTLDRIWVTGTPRTDALCTTDSDRETCGIRAALKGKRLVLYAPTWRRYRSDFRPFLPSELERLAHALQDQGAVLGLRLHPADEGRFSDLYGIHPAVLNCGSSIFPHTEAVLQATDVLVTDYSSIWIDFLLLRRPIIGYWPDKSMYAQERGTIWSLEEVFPGPGAVDADELGHALRNALSSAASCGIDAEHHAHALKLFHRFTNGGSARRVVDRIVEEVMS